MNRRSLNDSLSLQIYCQRTDELITGIGFASFDSTSDKTKSHLNNLPSVRAQELTSFADCKL